MCYDITKISIVLIPIVGAVGDISTTLDELRNAEADVMISPETHLATDQPFVQTQVYHECKKAFGLGLYKLIPIQHLI